jgi:hypothetical protein
MNQDRVQHCACRGHLRRDPLFQIESIVPRSHHPIRLAVHRWQVGRPARLSCRVSAKADKLRRCGKAPRTRSPHDAAPFARR